MSVNVNATARSLLLSEFVSAFFLAMRYFFKPKPTINYPFEKNPIPSSRDRISNSRPRRARSSIMTRRNFSPMATAGSARLRKRSNLTRRTGEVRA
jgi:hypothetical protein